MKSYLEITTRYLKVQKKRSFLAIVGIILSVSLITGIGTLLTSWWKSVIVEEIYENGDYHAIYNNVSGKDIYKVENQIDIGSLGLKKSEGFATICESPNSKDVPPYRYFDIKSYSDTGYKMQPIYLEAGRLPQKIDEIAFDSWALKYLPKGTKIGDTISLEVGNRYDEKGALQTKSHKWSNNEVFKLKFKKQYKIVGLLSPSYVLDKYFASAVTWVDGTMLVEDQKYDVIVKLDSIKDIHERVKKVGKNAGLDIKDNGANSISFNESVLRFLGQSWNEVLNTSMKVIVLIIVMLVVVATVAVIYNVFNISIIERISQYGLLRCVGATPGQIRKTVFNEAVILGSIGIPIGVITGTVAMGLVFKIINTITPGIKFAHINLYINPIVLVLSILVGIITVLLSAFLPSIKASRVSAIEAVRNSSSFKKESFKRIGKQKVSLKIIGVEGWIAGKNLGRNRKRFYITVFSMVISIALFIVFGQLVDFSFKSGIADKSETPNFALMNVKQGQKVAISEEDYKTLREMNGVTDIYKFGQQYAEVKLPASKYNKEVSDILNIKVQKDGNENVALKESNVYTYGDEEYKKVEEYLLEGKIDINEMISKDVAIVVRKGMIYDSQKKRPVILDVADIKPGDEITVDAYKDNKSKKMLASKKIKVLAVLDHLPIGEPRNAKGGIEIITSERLFKEISGDTDFPEMIMVQHDANKDSKEIKNFFEEIVDKDPSVQFIDYDQAAKEYKAGWLVLSIFMYGFVTVISLIGCLNIINTISTNIVLRTRELSVMRAIGMTERGIKKLICMESILHGTFAIAIGSIAGILLSRLIYQSVIGVREFEWTVPYMQILIASVGTIIIVLISGYLPLKRINSSVIIDGIRGEE